MINPIVAQIVDRIHVGKSDRYVCREIKGRMRASVPWGRRKQMYKQALNRHHDNQKLYADWRF